MKDIFIVLVPALTIVPTAVAAAMAMKHIASTTIEGMARQPQASSQLFTAMLVAMALVEALAIYSLVIALMVAAKM
jgi:F-type H+-transporting ATPase subunit c